MKIKDRDLEAIMRWIKGEKHELEDSLRGSFYALKENLKRSDWWGVSVEAEDLFEDALKLMELEIIEDKIEEKVEE